MKRFYAEAARFTGLLTAVFVALKLTGVIHWNWNGVLMPIYVAAIAFSLFLAGCFVVAFTITAWDSIQERRSHRN